MEQYTFTIFENQYDTVGHKETKSWAEWVARFSHHVQTGKPRDIQASFHVHNKAKNHTAVILGPTNGDGKGNKDVLEIQALSIDLDKCTEAQVAEILFEKLKPFEFVAWTTHKHGSLVAQGLPRMRVVLPLGTPHAPPDHLAVWNRLNALIGQHNDPATKNVGRIHFLPTTFDLSLAETLHNPGKLFSTDDLPVFETHALPPSEFTVEQDQEGIRGDWLSRIKRLEKHDNRKAPMLALLTGEDYAAKVEGHKTLVSCINYLAKFGDINESSFRGIFGPSIDAHAANSSTPETMDMVWKDYSQLRARKVLETEDKQRQYQSGPKYTDEDYDRIMEVQGLKTRDELRTRWILHHGMSSWFLNERGQYQGPYPKEDQAMAMRQHLSRAISLMHPPTQNAPPRMKSYAEVSYLHATLLEEVRADLALQQSTVEVATRGAILHFAINPMRTDLTPKYDPEIDEWLQVMCGSVYSKVVDWLSVYMDLDEFLCAIYFAGKAGCGKSLFAQGISKLWTHGSPTKLIKVLGNFNAGIEQCPVLFGDESIKKSGIQVTAEIRELLGNPSRTFEKKYLSPVDLGGHVRIVLAANHDRMLRDNEQKTKDDLEAIALRFLFIQPPPEATEFLKRKDIVKKAKVWGESGIARHALWLRENHTIETPGDRFVVEGDLSNMTTGLVMAEDVPTFVCETLVKFLQEPDKFLATGAHGKILKKGGSLYAMPSGVQEAWGIYLKQTHLLPETRPISESLGAICIKKGVTQKPPGMSARKYYEVDPEYLVRWAEDCGELSREEVMELIRKDSTGQSNDNVVRIHGDEDPDPTGRQY